MISKKIIWLSFFLIISFFTKAQSFFDETPDTLRKYAISFKANVRMDFFNNFTGGINQGSGYLGEGDLGVMFDSEKANWYKGGEFFIQGMTTYGKNPSANIVGDYQTFSNIDAENHISLYEMWYCQHFSNGKWSIIIGQLDMNADFSVSENAMSFINSSFGVFPTLSLNNSLSIFPLVTLGSGVKLKCWDKIAFQTAIYNGNAGDFSTNPNAINWKFSKEYGFSSITEFHYFNKKDTITTGTYKLGFFYHTTKYPGWKAGDMLTGNYSIYVVADQMLIPQSKLNIYGLNGFLIASMAPADRSLNDFFLGGGFRYHGLSKSRREDDIGLAFSYTNISKKYIELNPDTTLKNETAIELMYNYHLNKNIRIQPEFQYIIHPGATKLLKNSLVGLVRIHINI